MGKGGLKTALKSQQARFKAKERGRKAAHAVELKGKKPNRNTKPGNRKTQVENLQLNQKPIIPFQPTDKILLIGEGNFSFAHALIVHPPPTSGLEHLPPANVTATAYDTEAECYDKYLNAKEIVKALRERGVGILFGVDATRLEKVAGLKGRNWDRIIWNFPHAGKGVTDRDRNILSNQTLILDFLRSAAKILKTGPTPVIMRPKKKKTTGEAEADDLEALDPEDIPPSESPTPPAARGTILITLRNVEPYTLWELPRLAKKPPQPKSGSKLPNPSYIQLRSFVFHRDIWTGYEHRMTKGERAHGTGKTGERGEDRTWEFCLRD